MFIDFKTVQDFRKKVDDQGKNMPESEFATEIDQNSRERRVKIFFRGKLIASGGLRHGSKDYDYKYLPKQFHVTPAFFRQFAEYEKNMSDWLQMLGERGAIGT